MKIAMALMGLSIILATMFIKQHSFSDVVIATGLSLCSYILVYKLGFVFIPQEGIRFRNRKVRRRVRKGALSA
jgi:membrane-associated phospholipid phosphatase